MNQSSIKHLLKIGSYKGYAKTSGDLTLQTFYMIGPNVVPQEVYQSRAILPAIAYFPPEPDSDIDDYWAVAICTGPVDDNYSGISTMPFSYRPWKLRMNGATCKKEQLYTLAIILKRSEYI